VGIPARAQGPPPDRRVPEKVITQFSSRRKQITKTTLALALAHENEAERGAAPDQRVLANMPSGFGSLAEEQISFLDRQPVLRRTASW
jgi:hypothetical protein